MMKEMKVLAAALLAAVALPLSAPAEAGDLHLDLRIPVGLYGWTPLDGDWADTIAGAAGVRAGLEVFPLGGESSCSDKGIFLSGRACAGYGMLFFYNKNNGKEYMMTVMINTRRQYKIDKVSDGQVVPISGGWVTAQGLKGGFGVQNTISVSHCFRT